MTDTTATTRRRRPPAPVSISEQAQQFLNTQPPLDQAQQPEPDPDDTQGWLRWVATREAPGREMLSALTPPDDLLARTEVELDGVPTYVLRPVHVAEDSEAPIFLEIHGGALIMGGEDLAWMMAAGRPPTATAAPGSPTTGWRPCTPTPPRSTTASPSTATP